jgi:GAF domain-containing protein
MRFYAGYPVHFSGGECVAVLTIFDPRPRTFSAQEMSVLRNHALLIQDAIAQSSPRRHARAPGRRERPVQAEPVRHPAAASARHA